jgi:hypothetical protein
MPHIPITTMIAIIIVGFIGDTNSNGQYLKYIAFWVNSVQVQDSSIIIHACQDIKIPKHILKYDIEEGSIGL